MSSNHETRRQINLRRYRNKKYELSERFVNNTIEQSIQHEKLMLNCNSRQFEIENRSREISNPRVFFDGHDNMKSRIEVGKISNGCINGD
jgi:superfamily II DNA or RNA helicase